MRRGTWRKISRGGAVALLIAAPAVGAQAQEQQQPAGEAQGAPRTPTQGAAGLAPEGNAGAGAGAGAAQPGAAGAAQPGAAAGAEAGAAQPGAAAGAEAGAAQPGAAGAEAGAATQPGAAQPGGMAGAQPGAPAAGTIVPLAPVPSPSTSAGASAGAAAQGDGATGGGSLQQTAPMQRPFRIVQGGGQPTDAWRQLVGSDIDTAERVRIAAQQLADAETALGTGDAEAARDPLDLATQTLQAIYQEAPGARLASYLGALAAQLQAPASPPLDFAPISADLQAMKAVLPPKAVTQLQDARRQLRAGDRDGAARSLLGARESVMKDFELLPAEAAFARSRAALAELEAGNLALARSLVQGVPDSIAQLRTTAPLVPVRLRLRAAAGQANERNWAQAERLVNEAGSQLDQLRLDASPALLQRIDALRAQVGVLQERIAAGGQPSPRRIQQLAEAAGGTPAG